jgi:hypothetical protein
MATLRRSAALIFIASATAGCSGIPHGNGPEPYRSGPMLVATNDPLVPKREFPAWNPPKQFAVYRHLHKDAEQGVLFGGEWILLNLTEGGWYAEDFEERDPVPDREVSPLEVEAARRSLGDVGQAVVPYRVRN